MSSLDHGRQHCDSYNYNMLNKFIICEVIVAQIKNRGYS